MHAWCQHVLDFEVDWYQSLVDVILATSRLGTLFLNLLCPLDNDLILGFAILSLSDCDDFWPLNKLWIIYHIQIKGSFNLDSATVTGEQIAN